MILNIDCDIHFEKKVTPYPWAISSRSAADSNALSIADSNLLSAVDSNVLTAGDRNVLSVFSHHFVDGILLY